MSFYKLYFILQVCVQTVIFMLSYYALTKYIADNCEENMPDATADDCATMESAFGIRLVFNDIVAIALNVYYTYVCKLYAQ